MIPTFNISLFGPLQSKEILRDAIAEETGLELTSPVFLGTIVVAQGAADTILCSMQSTDVATGLTTAVDGQDVVTNDFFTLEKFAGATGGARVKALGENAAVTTNFALESYGGQADTTKSPVGRSLTEVYVAQHDGANALANVAADGNVFGIRARVGGVDVSRLLLNREGDLWLNGRIHVGASTPVGYVGNVLGNGFTSDGSSSYAIMTRVTGTLTGAAGDTSHLQKFLIDGAIVTQTATENIGHISNLRIGEPTITKNLTGNIGVASSLRVEGPPTEGLVNATVYVVGGDLKFFGSEDSAAVADHVALGGYEIGAGNRVLAISQETAVAADTDETKFSNKVQVRINGATYFAMLTTT